jgi:c-di-GMP-binding flagellar brake protein YcgR
MASESERRKYPRAKIRWPVSVKTPQVSLRGLTRNISPGGFSIHLVKPLEISLPLTISTTIATSGDTLKLTAEVVWSSNHGSDDESPLPSIGVRFIDISNEGRRAIGLTIFNQLIAEERKPANFVNLRALVLWGSSEH